MKFVFQANIQAFLRIHPDNDDVKKPILPVQVFISVENLTFNFVNYLNLEMIFMISTYHYFIAFITNSNFIIIKLTLECSQ